MGGSGHTTAPCNSERATVGVERATGLYVLQVTGGHTRVSRNMCVCVCVCVCVLFHVCVYMVALSPMPFACVCAACSGRTIFYAGYIRPGVRPGSARAGEVCEAATKSQQGNYLANLVLYPGERHTCPIPLLCTGSVYGFCTCMAPGTANAGSEQSHESRTHPPTR